MKVTTISEIEMGDLVLMESPYDVASHCLGRVISVYKQDQGIQLSFSNESQDGVYDKDAPVIIVSKNREPITIRLEERGILHVL